MLANTTRFLKNQIRQRMKARLASLTPEEYLSYNSAIKQRFFELPVVKYSHKVMIYYAINQEVETISMINSILAEGKIVALPTCMPEKNLRAGMIGNLDELVPGLFGLSEPDHTTLEIKPQDFDLIIIPGLAFDKRGFRLGHGAGYYDRFLAKTDAFKLGLGYGFQLVDELPINPHDIPVDAILTDLEYREIDNRS
jgi:5-formyltetrahydrofolate cyclo-ligase